MWSRFAAIGVAMAVTLSAQIASAIRYDEHHTTYEYTFSYANGVDFVFGFNHEGWDIRHLKGSTITFDSGGFTSSPGLDSFYWWDTITPGGIWNASVTFGDSNLISDWSILNGDPNAMGIWYFSSAPLNISIDFLREHDPVAADFVVNGGSLYGYLYSAPDWYSYISEKGSWEMRCFRYAGMEYAGECAAINAIPLPATGLLLAGGLICLIAASRRGFA